MRIPSSRPRLSNHVADWQRRYDNPSRLLAETSDDPDEIIWQETQPLNPETWQPAKRSGAICAKCGNSAGEQTPRGTLVLCETDNVSLESETARRTSEAISRVRSHNARSNAARDANKPLTTEVQLMIADRGAQLIFAIGDLIADLDPDDARNPDTRARAAGMVGRLVKLRDMLNGIVRNPKHDSLEQISKLERLVIGEAEIARSTITELNRARVPDEYLEAVMVPAPAHRAIEPPREIEPEPITYEPATLEQIDTGYTCDMRHAIQTIAWFSVIVSHAPYPRVQQTDMRRFDLCADCFAQFQQDNTRLTRANGYEYAYWERL